VLNQRGLPGMPGTWQSMFADANDRCRHHEVDLRAHPHILRHTYAVVTLEQLQREHIRELGAMNPGQRTTYEQVFGDPLDWVRRRLGHRSVETTFKYLHTLNELAMETRLALFATRRAAPKFTPAELIVSVPRSLTPIMDGIRG
jgi:integrase